MKELLFSVPKNDFIIQTFRSGGKGGQNQNKVETGVRIIHKYSDAVGESREQRSQLQNKQTAFRRLVETKEFKSYLRLRSAQENKKEKDINKIIEERVNEMMKDENLKVEFI